MIRTQIQLPDDLYAATKKTAARLEISLAELVRRGLEYMLAVLPSYAVSDEWHLPAPRELGTNDPFEDSEWRAKAHTAHLYVAEETPAYGKEKPR